ncbi:MAG: photosystem II protein Psb27 [Cyanobacteria bacterium]|nr:photosystem II protein Psb27 [Cyanobacteriota bacterium]
MAAGWRRVMAALFAVCLSLSLALTACSSASGPLTGNYVEDTMTVAERLIATIAISPEDPDRATAETEARSLITAYMARYRPQAKINGLASFTTMQTAINSLAGHYTNYANRPLPEALKARLDKELKRAEASVVRGA